MAHALDARDNGNTSFVSLRKPAWHKLGTIAQDELSYDEALQLGGLDYPMVLRPVTTTMPIFDASGEETDSYELATQARAILRLDTKTVFGVVGDQYELVTNRQATQVVSSTSMLLAGNPNACSTAAAVKPAAKASAESRRRTRLPYFSVHDAP